MKASEDKDRAPDPWEANRDRQLELWASLPPSHRVAWLEDAVAAARRSGALPRRLEREGMAVRSGGAETAHKDLPLPPLAGPAEACVRGEQSRLAALSRLSSFFRGPCPPNVDRTRFAEYGVLVRFALWRETDASFWAANAEASVLDLIVQAARRDARLAGFLREQADDLARSVCVRVREDCPCES